MAKRVELTEPEWAIIKEVWRLQPCAAPSVQEALESSRGWSYSTVRTMMDRMAAKGLLRTEKVRNLTLFRAAIKQGDAQKSAVRSILEKAFNGALTPLVQCLLESEKITPGELAELEKLIKAKKQSK
jgi:BlaI family penicillinase repressor